VNETIPNILNIISIVISLTGVIVSVVGWIIVAARADQRHDMTGDDHEQRIEELEKKTDRTIVELAEIRTDVKWIRHSLERRNES
jgi:hypothetical protein